MYRGNDMWWQLPALIVIIALIYFISKGDRGGKGNNDYKNEDDEDYVM